MQPCYIVTYYVHGPCAVDANAVEKYNDEQEDGFNKCRLHFKDGSQLRLEESCDDFKVKQQDCRPNYPSGIPVFPK